MKRWTAMLAMLAGLAGAATPVETHGNLSVKGNKVVGEDGNPANLRGMSLFWSQWAPEYWNRDAMGWLASDWKASVVRAPMAVDNGGYLTSPALQMKRVDSVVQAAIDDGIYVIVDWHDHDANLHVAQAKTFFETMAAKYGNTPNVIWEIWNEPNDKNGSGAGGYDTWEDIKWYANQVIPAIRAHSRNVIVVGTSSWSQGVHEAAAAPIAESNIAYTLHFYAASHGQWLRDRALGAMNSGIAIFVTEWGTCEASGDGALSFDESSKWLGMMDDQGISWANWSIVAKDETCAALRGTPSERGGWGAGDLSTSGAWVRAELRKRGDYTPTVRDTFALPGTIDASKPSARTGAKVEADAAGSGSHLAYIDSGTAASYLVKTSKDGRFALRVSAASANDGGAIRWSLDGRAVATTTVAGSGGWQSWTDAAGPALLVSAGVHTLRLDFQGSGTGLFNLKSIAVARLPADTFAVPGTVDASKPSSAVGPQIEAGATDSGSHLAWIDAGASAQYVVRAARAGAYAMTISVASAGAGGSVGWSLDGRYGTATTAVAPTGGWQSWVDIAGPAIPLTAGVHELRLDFKGTGAGLFNLAGIGLAWKAPLAATRRPAAADGVRLFADRVEIASGSWTRATLLDAGGRVVASLAPGGAPATLAFGSLRGRGFLRLDGAEPLTIPVMSVR